MERFWNKVNKTDSCWIWTAATSHGYGAFRINGKTFRSHRVAYELVKGEIPNGLFLDHLCRNRACVNPDHLEPVTNEENLSRGIRANGNTYKTNCINGHSFTDENTRLLSRGERVCKICERERNKKYLLAKSQRVVLE